MQQQGVMLRIKRRRDYQAPDEIVLEATSRTSALLTDLQRSLGLESSKNVSREPIDAFDPPKKRCRFVLLKPALQEAAQEQQQQQPPHYVASRAAAATADAAKQAFEHSPAAAVAVPPGTRVLDLWHSSGVAYPPGAACNSKGMGGRTKQLQGPGPQQHTNGHPSVADSAAAAAGAATSQPAISSTARASGKEIMYEHMVHEYLHQQQQQTRLAAAETSSVQPCKPPSKRAVRAHTHTAAATAAGLPHVEPSQQQQQQQQQQPQSTQLPDYMTKEMLQQYGLSAQAHQMSPAAATAAAEGQTISMSYVESSDEPEYVYDMYIPAYEDMHVDNIEEHSQQQEQQQDDNPTGATVVQVWEEDLAGFDDWWPVPARTATAAAAGIDSEDSNAEDYYANDYPDEAESCHSRDEDNESFAEHNSADDLVAEQAGNAHDSLITCYKPQLRPRAGHTGVADGVESEEFDVDEYESSGDEEQLQGWYNSGAAWRAILAKECGMLQQDSEGMADDV